MKRISRIAAVLGLSATALLAPSAANAASINLSRNPAPPAAVKNDGGNQLLFNYQATYTTTARRVRTQIIAPNSVVVPGSTVDTSVFGASSPIISSTQSYTVPAGLAPGRYLVSVAFYSDDFCDTAGCPSPADDANFEARAQVQFDVAAATGNIIVRKFEDANGDGIRQGNESSIPNWDFSVTAPRPDFVGSDVYSRSTDGSGTFTLSGVPAGPLASYSVSEIIPNPNPSSWAPTTSATRTTGLADGATASLEFGNARLTSLCGTVFKDANRNGQRDTDEVVFADSPVTLTLGGADGRGNVAAGTTTTDANGRYCFNGLMPGTYNVRESVPAGWDATGDKDGVSNGATFINPITLTSGQPSDGNDFGLAQPPVVVEPPVVINPPVVVPEPRTKICLTKKVDKKSIKQGASVTWTVTVRNCGTAVAYEVAVNDPLLGDTTLGKHSGATLVRGQLIWSTGTLAVGASRTYKFSTRFDRDARIGSHTNTAKAGARNADEVTAKAKTKITKVVRKAKKVAVTG